VGKEEIQKKSSREIELNSACRERSILANKNKGKEKQQ